MARRIRQGVGLCLSPHFLRDKGDASTIEDMIHHLAHFLNISGEDILAVGTDFDGTSGHFDIGSPAEILKLFERLDQHGWPQARIEKLAYKKCFACFG